TFSFYSPFHPLHSCSSLDPHQSKSLSFLADIRVLRCSHSICHPFVLLVFSCATASIRTNEPGLVEPSPVTGEVASPASVTLSAEATPAGVREQQARYTASAKQRASSGSFGSSSSYGGSSSQSSYGGSSSQ